MADLQDIVKQIEEERKKAAEEELKQRQNVKEQQKKDAKILSDVPRWRLAQTKWECDRQCFLRHVPLPITD